MTEGHTHRVQWFHPESGDGRGKSWMDIPCADPANCPQTRAVGLIRRFGRDRPSPEDYNAWYWETDDFLASLEPSNSSASNTGAAVPTDAGPNVTHAGNRNGSRNPSPDSPAPPSSAEETREGVG